MENLVKKSYLTKILEEILNRNQYKSAILTVKKNISGNSQLATLLSITMNKT